MPTHKEQTDEFVVDDDDDADHRTYTFLDL